MIAGIHKDLQNRTDGHLDYPTLQIRSKEIKLTCCPFTQAFGKCLIPLEMILSFVESRLSPPSSIILSVFKRLGTCGEFNPHVYDSF